MVDLDYETRRYIKAAINAYQRSRLPTIRMLDKMDRRMREGTFSSRLRLCDFCNQPLEDPKTNQRYCNSLCRRKAEHFRRDYSSRKVSNGPDT